MIQSAQRKIFIYMYKYFRLIFPTTRTAVRAAAAPRSTDALYTDCCRKLFGFLCRQPNEQIIYVRARVFIECTWMCVCVCVSSIYISVASTWSIIIHIIKLCGLSTVLIIVVITVVVLLKLHALLYVFENSETSEISLIKASWKILRSAMNSLLTCEIYR